jgi:hypothetical protein
MKTTSTAPSEGITSKSDSKGCLAIESFSPNVPGLSQRFNPEVVSYRIICAVRASTDHSAFRLADQLTSTNSLSKMRVNRGRGILSRWHFEVICAVRVAHAAPWAKCPLCWSSGFIRAAPQPSDDLSLHVVLNDYGELGPPTAVEPAIPPPATHSQWCDSFLLPYRC